MKKFIVKQNCIFEVTAIIALISTCVAYSGKAGWGPGGEVKPKPGDCPPSDPFLSCFVQQNLCNSDCECPMKQKCCFQQSCGYSCKEPTIIIDDAATCEAQIAPSIKPGQCPPPLLTLRCSACIDKCKSDCECEGQMKCCEQPACGNMCREANTTKEY